MSIRRPRSLVGAVVAALTALAVLAGCAPAAAPGTGVDPADDDRPLVAFYGDSYTLGTGASDLSVRWSTQLAELRGWREFNPSVNGLGFINNRRSFDDTDLPTLIIDQQPDIVIVTMGLNDSFWYTAERPASLETIIGWVRAAADRYDLPFIPGASTWIAGAPGLMATDGLHPNDEGYALMLEKMDAAIAELGL